MQMTCETQHWSGTMTDTPGDMAAKLEAWAKFADADRYDECWEVQETPEGKTLRAAASMLRECAEREKALREALQGVLSDDDASTSLADQRARWPERMAALKRAMGE